MNNFVKVLIALPSLLGAILLLTIIPNYSATYDEVSYVRIACHWWQTGEQAEITRMGSPVSFWKFQAYPGLLWLSLSGHQDWISEKPENLPRLLPLLRYSAAWIWFVGLWAVQYWAWAFSGVLAAILAGLIYCLSPNLLAHGSLMTMETPLWVTFFLSVMFYCEWMKTSSRKWFLLSAAFAGMAFSMKFTAVLLPFLVTFVSLIHRLQVCRSNINKKYCFLKGFWKSLQEAALYASILVLSNLILTGFAVIPLSEHQGDHPWLEQRFSKSASAFLTTIIELPYPVDWVGFITQMRHQRSGGPGYLLGEKSNTGWFIYYPVTLLVKCPLVILMAIAIRLITIKPTRHPSEWMIPAICLLFIFIACVGSKRNYGFRYLLPLAPLVIVWLSGFVNCYKGRFIGCLVVLLLGANIYRVHPWELTYFNELVGGPIQGAKILSDSNLDWGQGLIQLRDMQESDPELHSMTTFYFGDIYPRVYGIIGSIYRVDATDQFKHLPPSLDMIQTRHLAVSTSLIYGPWGPDHYFDKLKSIIPFASSPDGSILVYQLW